MGIVKVNEKNLYDYMYGLNPLPKEIGQACIKGQRSDCGIAYYRWDMEFVQDVDAKKNNNAGIDEIQIIFNLNRDIKWTVGQDTFDKRYQVVDMKKGDVCIYRNDNICTSMHYDRGKNFQFKSLQIKTDIFKKLLIKYFSENEATKIESSVCDRVQKTRITPEMYRILSEIDSADRYKEFKGIFLESKMTELTALVLFGVIHDKSIKEEYLAGIDNSDIKALESLREWIQIKPYNDYDANTVAEDLSFSVSKLNRLFRKVYGISLHAYVLEQRLEYAAELLSKGEMNVTEASIESGYNNVSYFTKAFKKRFGIAPKRFMSEKC